MVPVYAIHFHEDDQVGDKISDLYISATIVNSAREKFKLFEQEMDIIREKCTTVGTREVDVSGGHPPIDYRVKW